MKRFMMTLALTASLIFVSATPQPAQADDGTIGTIIGAVGGGLLGSAMGKGKGRLVSTAAGTVIGAVLGHEIATNDPYEEPTVYTNRNHRVHTPVYKPAPTRVVYREVSPRPKTYKQVKKWDRVARYDQDILVCNKNGKRCHWYD